MIDGVDCEDGIVTDVGMAAFQAGAAYGDQRLEEFSIKFFEQSEVSGLGYYRSGNANIKKADKLTGGL
jgi:hypothetical protein